MFSNPLVAAAYFVVNGVLNFFLIVMFATMILSWLMFFNIVNPRNTTVYQIWRFLDLVTAPILAPFRKVIPNLGGIDISFLVCWLCLSALQRFLLPAAFIALDNALTPHI